MVLVECLTHIMTSTLSAKSATVKVAGTRMPDKWTVVDCDRCHGNGSNMAKGLDGIYRAFKCARCKGTGKLRKKIEKP
jgi:DnaJ-class molecular chaperone